MMTFLRVTPVESWDLKQLQRLKVNVKILSCCGRNYIVEEVVV
jgi:hypothetical protein